MARLVPLRDIIDHRTGSAECDSCRRQHRAFKKDTEYKLEKTLTVGGPLGGTIDLVSGIGDDISVLDITPTGKITMNRMLLRADISMRRDIAGHD